MLLGFTCRHRCGSRSRPTSHVNDSWVVQDLSCGGNSAGNDRQSPCRMLVRMGPVGTPLRTVCSYCGVGCGITVSAETSATGAAVVGRVIGDKAHPTNHGRLCTKGATHAEMMAP